MSHSTSKPTRNQTSSAHGPIPTEGEVRRIVVVGATGLIGSAIVGHLSATPNTQVLGVTHQSSPALDLEDPVSIQTFFSRVGRIDHVVVAAGDARFGGFSELDEAAFRVGLFSKLMGQVNIAMEALRMLPIGGSVTLTSGALSHSPIPGSSAVALVNGALDSFVRAIALDAPEGRRINVVSPGWIRETRVKLGLPPDPGVSASDVARLYLESIDSDAHGRVLSVAETGAADGGKSDRPRRHADAAA